MDKGDRVRLLRDIEVAYTLIVLKAGEEGVLLSRFQSITGLYKISIRSLNVWVSGDSIELVEATVHTPAMLAALDRQGFYKELTTLCSFLVWMRDKEPDAMWGGRTVQQALTAASRLIRMSEPMMEEIACPTKK